jgi:hypothetical protein
MLALLAPVPREHLGDALEICEATGNVAFGSGSPTEESSGAWSFDFFSQDILVKEEGHLPVLIYASHDKDTGPLHASYRGIYNGFEKALTNGKHHTPVERPKTALATDGRFAIFWKVKSLEELKVGSQFALKNLRTRQSGKPGMAVSFVPRGPQLVFMPDE